jgi:hypothetical protein
MARPKPELLADRDQIVGHCQTSYQAVFEKINRLFASASPEVSSRRPAEDNWSANEVLAHLIWSERHQHFHLWAIFGGYGNIAWPNNGPLHLAGLLAAHPTHTALLAELERALTETCAIISVIPEGMIESKAVRMLLIESNQGTVQHIEAHLPQIEAALTAIVNA